MSFATARVAPEKQFHRLPAVGPFCDVMEMDVSRSSYSEKLRDPRWQRKRLEALDLAEWTCEVCADSSSTLHVHHRQYIKGREPWEYDPNQLSVLCEMCHEEHHSKPDRLMDVISRLPIEGMKWIDRDKAACLIAGVLGLEDFVCGDHVELSWFRVGFSVQELADEEFDKLVKQTKSRESKESPKTYLGADD